MKIGWKVTKPLPPCGSCGTPTANFASLLCQPCKAKRLAEAYGMGDVQVGRKITGAYPN